MATTDQRLTALRTEFRTGLRHLATKAGLRSEIGALEYRLRRPHRDERHRRGRDQTPVAIRIISAVLALILLAAGPAAAGTLRVGTVGDYPPFNYIDDASELTGFDIDVARALCERLEARCLFQRHPWSMLIPELRAGTFDAIVASMSITEERRRVVAFTDRYYSNVSKFVTSKGSNFHPDELDGRTVGALRATIASDWLDEYAAGVATIKLYDSQPELLQALALARVDAVFGDVLGLYAWLMGPTGSAFTFVGDGIELDEGIGIALRQGDEDLRLGRCGLKCSDAGSPSGGTMSSLASTRESVGRTSSARWRAGEGRKP